ncbi:ABC transporter permease [Clostridium sp. CF011]|uniref:ABC transporter permease n=1 Tax=unclassified Clostridium TaxID=2614128 RepID=UPI001C0B76D7|nr:MULTISPECIES: ABC transporter permease [unclassified Clostridium]MBU3090756.1 ABC transporter permease [Clostridium sp. CF011]MBW9144679.1 ABC transporter permease [Clostridium sp. CM027]UVE40569.1 ABC transporter permease [Clostridium sp. CM027]WAG69532.1 ABC transporter permease [Clostridium sp. CF011]
MNFIKRAILSVTKRKSKTVLLIVMFCVIANMVLAGLAIQSATAKVAVLARQKLGGSVSIELDQEKIRAKNSSDIPRLNMKDMDKLKSLEHVKSYNYLTNSIAMAENFKPVKEENKNEVEPGQQGGMSMSMKQGEDGEEQKIPDLSIDGALFSNLYPAFTEGKSKLIEGRHLKSSDEGKNVTMINKKLADANNLKLGDKIKIKDREGKETLDLEIVGLFTDDGTEHTPIMDAFPFMNPSNTIYTPNSVASLMDFSSKDTFKVATYFLDDPIHMENFKKAIKNSGIALDDFKIDAQDSLYKKLMTPIENVGSFSKTIVIIVAIAGTVILSLLINLSLKGRRYEIGVLMSLGESRFRIIGQLLLELIIVATIAFSIATFTGNKVSQTMGNTLLQNEITANKDKDANSQSVSSRNPFEMSAHPSQNDDIDTIDNMDVSVSSKDLQKLYLMGFIIVILATSGSAVSILRFNPKTILSRND